MRTASRLFAATALAAVATGGAVSTTAVADDHWDQDKFRPHHRAHLTVTPHTPRPGAHVTLVQKGGCHAPVVKAWSHGFTHPVHLRHKGGSYYVGTAQVRHHAQVGKHYRVVSHCPDGRKVEGGFTVSHWVKGGSGAGVGGSIAGVNSTSVAAGSALLAAAAVGSVLVARRRASGKA
jgi:hypothetical protein